MTDEEIVAALTDLHDVRAADAYADAGASLRDVLGPS